MLTSNPSFDLNLYDPFIKGLACAAIRPGLRSVLIFDAPYTDLETNAAILFQMLKCASGEEVELVRLGVTELDDDLWGTILLSHSIENSPIVLQRGVLVGLTDSAQMSKTGLRLVVIPDLGKLSLAASRACVMLMGADVAHLERHGQHKTFQPNICWLASCARSEVGAISPHLLDRFAIRLDWQATQGTDSTNDRVALLRKMVNEDSSEDITKISLPREVKVWLHDAVQIQVALSDEAIERILYYMSIKKTYLPRREIALARLAVTCAQLEGASLATAVHVDAAADILGLLPTTQPSERTLESRVEQPATTPNINQESSTANSSEEDQRSLPSIQQETSSNTETIYTSNETEMLEPASVTVDPYPEDTAAIKREVASLRLPEFQYSAATSAHRGSVTGVERANTLDDLAIVDTLIAAAPFQPYRREHKGASNGHLVLSAIDLRSYRRAPAAEHMLLILLDYTSVGECDWQQALLPFLRKAYTERAGIGIVQVGAVDATNEFQAELVSARSILVPSIGAALDVKAGRATPLAHGFDLALRTFLHALQHGRNTVQQASFIVISDGRGNVPLKVSRNEDIVRSISREGIEDSLKMARLIRDLKRVQTILLNPQPKHYPDLPLALADVLGAEVQNIPPLANEEV